MDTKSWGRLQLVVLGTTVVVGLFLAVMFGGPWSGSAPDANGGGTDPADDVLDSNGGRAQGLADARQDDASEMASPDRSALQAAPEEPSLSEPQVVSAMELLETYWGRRWPEVESWLLASGRPVPDFLVNLSHVPPIEDVLPSIEEAMLFGGVGRTEEEYRAGVIARHAPDELQTLEAISRTTGFAYLDGRRLTTRDLEELQSRLAPLQREAERIAGQIADLQLEARARAFEQGDWIAHPLVAYEPDLDGVRSSLSEGMTTMMSGVAKTYWAFSGVVDLSASPLYDYTLQQLEDANSAFGEASEQLVPQFGEPISGD